MCLLLEKNELDEVGSFDALGWLEVIDGVLDNPVGVLLFLLSLSGCFADRNPKVPREAISVAGSARVSK